MLICRTLSCTCFIGKRKQGEHSLWKWWGSIGFWKRQGIVILCRHGSTSRLVGVPPPQTLIHVLFFWRPIETDFANIGVPNDMHTSFPLAQPLLAVEECLRQHILALVQSVL